MKREFTVLLGWLVFSVTSATVVHADALEAGWDDPSGMQPIDVSERLDELELTAARFFGRSDEDRTALRETMEILAAYEAYSTMPIPLSYKDRTIKSPPRELRRHVYLPGIRTFETYEQMRTIRSESLKYHEKYFGESRNAAAASDARRIHKRISEIGKKVAAELDRRLARRHDLLEGISIKSIKQLRELAEQRQMTLKAPARPSDRKQAAEYDRRKRAFEHGRKEFTRLWKQRWAVGEPKFQQERLETAIASLPTDADVGAADSGGSFMVVFRVHAAYSDRIKPPLKISHDEFIVATYVSKDGLKQLKARNARRNFGWRRNSGNSIERPFAHYERSKVTYLKVVELTRTRAKETLADVRTKLAALGPHHRFPSAAYAGPMNRVRTLMNKAPSIGAK